MGTTISISYSVTFRNETLVALRVKWTEQYEKEVWVEYSEEEKKERHTQNDAWDGYYKTVTECIVASSHDIPPNSESSRHVGGEHAAAAARVAVFSMCVWLSSR